MSDRVRTSAKMESKIGEITFNPFPGLRPFGVEESHLFFGREGQSDEILSKLSDNRFVAVIGASGSGKSSLMYCGLIPTLFGGFLADAGSNWRIVVSRPGIAPIDNLAEAIMGKKNEYDSEEDLGEEFLIRKTILSTVLRSSSLGLVEAIKTSRAHSDENVFILIDQFEELFRYRKTEEPGQSQNESAAFVQLLLEAVAQSEVPIYIATTMRSDFIGDCAQFPELTQLINESHYLIPQMTRNQKRLAIEGPVAVGGGKMSPRLVQQLLNDVGDSPDQLPILQHALMRTWDFWSQNRLGDEIIDLEHYDAIGRLSEALSMHANEAYDELNEQQKDICEAIFKALTEKGSENFGIRRPTKLKVLAKVAGVKETEVVKVIERFREPGRSLLMPPHGIDITSETIIDISHESLMRIWTRLRNWVEEEAESAGMYLKLSEAASNYQSGRSGLWRPPDLQLGLNWKQKYKPSREWAQRYDPAYERAIVFLDTSNKEYETEQRNKERAQRKTLQRARMVAIVFGSIAVLTMFLVILAYVQKLEADRQSERADAEAKNALAQAEIARQNEEVANIQSRRAQEEQEKAEKSAEIAQKERANAVYQAQIANQQRALADQRRKEADDSRFLAEEATKVAISEQERADNQAKEAYRLRMLSIAQSMAVKSLQIQDVGLRGLVARQAYEINNQYGGSAFSPDIYDAVYYGLQAQQDEKIQIKRVHAGSVRALLFTQGSRLLSAGSDGTIKLSDIESLEKASLVIDSVGQQVVRSMVQSPDGKQVIMGSNYAGLLLFDLKPDNTLQMSRKVKGQAGAVWSMDYDDKGRLFTASSDSSIWMFDGNNWTPWISLESRPFEIKIDKSNKRLLAALENGNLVSVDIANKNVEVKFTNAGVAIKALTLSANGGTIAIGDEKGAVKLLSGVDFTLIRLLPGHFARISSLRFSPDDQLLASASLDRSVRVYQMQRLNDQPLVFKAHDTWVWDVQFDPSSAVLVAGVSNGDIKKWPVSPSKMAAEICSFMDREMDQIEWNQYVGEDIPYEKTCDR